MKEIEIAADVGVPAADAHVTYNRGERSEEQHDSFGHSSHDSCIVGILAEYHNADKRGNYNAVGSVYEHGAYPVHEHRLDVFGDVAARADVDGTLYLYYSAVLYACNDFGSRPLHRRGDYAAGEEPFERACAYEHCYLQTVLQHESRRGYYGGDIVVFIGVDQRSLGTEQVGYDHRHEHKRKREVDVLIQARIIGGEIGQEKHDAYAADKYYAADDEIERGKQAI